MIIDIQLSPAVEPWESIRDGVVAAEQAGFGTAWVFDHFTGHVLRGHSMLECFTLLGAMAASTTTIGLGTLVVNVANRNPGVMAMSAASVQAISAGRLTLGLGAGPAPGTAWSWEHRDLGLHVESTLAARHRRLGAALDELERLWDPDRADDLAGYPMPQPRPPVILGVNSVPLARLAGERTDGINVRWNHEALDELIETAVEAHDASPRAAHPFDVSVWCPWDETLADPEHPDRLGVDRLVLQCGDGHDVAAIDRVGRRVGSTS
jgi:alkanesulfonate monooxygenase SsuD/methylene tetrahydromethanopterin reductase-like flavin-dependent oxidoreductase (luciferase family)